MTLRELVEELGIEVAPPDHHHATPNRIQVDCPHCSPGTRKYRMGISEFSFRCSCWVCGPNSHQFLTTLSLASGIAYKAICALASGLTRPDPSSPRIRDARAIKTTLPAGVGELLSVHTRYLRSRGFDPTEIVNTWRVQGIGQAGFHSWRLFIPVYLDGNLVSWTTRSVVDEAKSRYLSAPDDDSVIGIKDVLYGEDNCSHAVILNEGPLDAWTVGPGAVATCGLGLTETQLLRAARFPVRVVVMDNEPKAQERAESMCRQLALFPGETHRVVLSGKDASRSPKKEIRELRRRFLE